MMNNVFHILYLIMLGARSTLANNIDKSSNVVWNVDQRFLTERTKHCIQLKILYFLLLSMVERFVGMWSEVRVCIYFQKIENDCDDSSNEERYNKAYKSIQSNQKYTNNNSNNINNNNKDNIENEKGQGKDRENGKEKGKEKNKHKKNKKEKLDWLKGNLVIEFGYSRKKILIKEYSSAQGMTSLYALHKVLTDAGGGCTVKNGAQNNALGPYGDGAQNNALGSHGDGAQYNALGYGTPLIGVRDGTVLDIPDSIFSIKIDEKDKRDKKDNDNEGDKEAKTDETDDENRVKRRECEECEEGLTCWMPCNVLLMNSFEEHSSLYQEDSSLSQKRCPSKRMDRLMDLFIDSSERKHSNKKHKLSPSRKSKKRKKSKSESTQKYEKMTKNDIKNRKKSWIKIPEFNRSLLNLNRKLDLKEMKSSRDNSGVAIGHKNENTLKQSHSTLPGCLEGLIYSADYIKSKVQTRHDDFRNSNDKYVLHNSNANTICKIIYNNDVNKKDNDDKDNNNNDNNKLKQLEWTVPNSRLKRGSNKGNESYTILDCGNPYWQSKPILSPTAPSSTFSSFSSTSTSPPFSPSFSPSHSPSLPHLLSPTFSPSPSPLPSPSHTPTHSSSFSSSSSSSSSPLYSTSKSSSFPTHLPSSSSSSSSSYTSFSSSSPISSIPILSPNLSQELKSPNNRPLNIEIINNNNDETKNHDSNVNENGNGSGGGNGKKENRIVPNKEQTKLRASLHALSSAAMLSSLVDDDLKEYNDTVSWDTRRRNKPSRKNSFSAVINSLSKSLRNSFSTSPTVLLSDK